MGVKYLKIDFVKITGFLFLGIILLLIISFTFLPKYTKIRELAEEDSALSKKIEEEEKEIDRLKQGLGSIEKDSFYLEKLAREQLGTVREDEVVIHIEE